MDTTALLVEVKRFAVHDGPGVRTVFFLKGCPLKCRWCHNPESISPRAELAYYKHKCIQCGECVSVCPAQAHAMLNGKHHFERSKCTACGACEEACLGNALKFFGRSIDIDEAEKIALEDWDFYDSGGGVTMSGGEPLLQAEFCAELFKALKKENIHCAVDTCGAVSWKKLEAVLPYTDIFLYDLKHVDEKLHIEYTGCSNKLILENLKKLSESNIPVEIRIPVIPGFNMDSKSIKAIKSYLGGLSDITAVKLLAYHDLSKSKYEALGKNNDMPAAKLPSDKQMNNIACELRESGIPVLCT